MISSNEQASLQNRRQSRGEEIANAISHGVGFLAAAGITPLLLIRASSRGTAAVVGASIFCATMMILYLTSTLYHSFPHSRTKTIFNILDHGAIFLLIAGTYTPFSLGALYGPWGWSLFGITWGLALLGVTVKSITGATSSKLSTILYVGMGWIAVVAAKPLWISLSVASLSWLFAGGLLYTLGVLFFVKSHTIRYTHFIWHLFVLGGTACHVMAVLDSFDG